MVYGHSGGAGGAQASRSKMKRIVVLGGNGFFGGLIVRADRMAPISVVRSIGVCFESQARAGGGASSG